MASRAERGRRAAVALAGASALVAALVICPGAASAGAKKGGGGPAGTRAADPFALTGKRAHVATVVVPTRALRAPGSDRRVATLPALAEWGGGPVRLLILRSALHEGRRWLRVRLPQRPNSAAGWIRADLTRISATPWRITVSTRRARVAVSKRGRVVRRFSAVVGTSSTPTPRGLFAVSERIRQPSGSVLGPWALHLTAHSRVLRNYGGGPGRVALHGRSGSLLADPLGSRASHGCIRMNNSRIRFLARVAREGTPVLVRR